MDKGYFFKTKLLHFLYISILYSLSFHCFSSSKEIEKTKNNLENQGYSSDQNFSENILGLTQKHAKKLKRKAIGIDKRLTSTHRNELHSELQYYWNNGEFLFDNISYSIDIADYSTMITTYYQMIKNIHYITQLSCFEVRFIFYYNPEGVGEHCVPWHRDWWNEDDDDDNPKFLFFCVLDLKKPVYAFQNSWIKLGYVSSSTKDNYNAINHKNKDSSYGKVTKCKELLDQTGAGYCINQEFTSLQKEQDSVIVHSRDKRLSHAPRSSAVLRVYDRNKKPITDDTMKNINSEATKAIMFMKNICCRYKICKYIAEKPYSCNLNIDKIITYLTNKDPVPWENSELITISQNEEFKSMIDTMKHHYNYQGLKSNDIDLYIETLKEKPLTLWDQEKIKIPMSPSAMCLK